MNIKKLFAPIDMTQGKPSTQIILFAIPMLIGNIAQQLYSTVDSIVVGQYVGDNALAAVDSASPIYNLLLVLFIGISTGAGIMVSQYFGARDRENLSSTIGNCITLTALCTIILMVISIFTIRPLLQLLNTPASIMEWCNNYLFILLMGIGGTCYYNILCGVLRGLGDSVSALVYLLIATVINIVLDLYFVAGLGMEVAGVALATIIAQAVSAILCFMKLIKMKHLFDLEKRHYMLQKKHSLEIIKLGVPSGLTQGIFSMAMILVQSLTNSFGEMVIAANVIVMRVDGFAMMPNFSFGNAMTTYTGQNIGAKEYKRVEEGAKEGTKIAIICASVITAIILIFGDILMYAFTDTAELVHLSMNIMRILAVGYIAVSITQSLSGVMRGAGDTMSPMWVSIITTVIVRVPLAYILAYLTRSDTLPNGSHYSMFISLLVSWLLGAIITFVIYRKKKWLKSNIES